MATNFAGQVVALGDSSSFVMWQEVGVTAWELVAARPFPIHGLVGVAAVKVHDSGVVVGLADGGDIKEMHALEGAKRDFANDGWLFPFFAFQHSTEHAVPLNKS